MPLNDFQKRRALELSGYDPSSYTIDDEDNIIEVNNEQPSISSVGHSIPKTTLQTTFDTPSPLETYGKTFLRNAPVAAAGGVGAATGVALAEGLGLTGLMSWAPPVALSLGAAYGAGKLLDYLEPQEVSDAYIRSTIANPTAATLGGLSTIPLGGFNFSPRTLGRGIGGGVKLLTGLNRTPQEIAALRNMGVGAIVGGAGSVGSAGLEGEMPDTKQIVEGILTGALFNKPNEIGRRMGFRDIPTQGKLPIDRNTIIDVDSDVTPLQTQPTLTADQLVAAGGVPRTKGVTVDKTGGIRVRTSMPGEEAGTGKEIPKGKFAYSFEQPDLMTFEGEGGRPVPETEVERSQAKIEELVNQKVAEKEDQLRTDFEDQLEQNRIEADLGGEEQPLYQEETTSRPTTKFEQQTNKQLTEELGGGIPITKRFKDIFARFGAEQRNTVVQEDGTITNAKTGKPIAGVSWLRNGLKTALAKINPAKEGLDTRSHELFHVFVDDLAKHGSATDKKLVKDYYSLIENSPEFKSINDQRTSQGREAWDANEFATTEQGMEFLRRNLNLENESGLNTYYKDLWSHIKTKYASDNATNADFRRLLQYRFQNDPSFRESYGGGNAKFKSAVNPDDTTKEQEVSGQRQKDIEEYFKLDEERKKLIASGKHFNADGSNFSEEYFANWKAMENVKNKYSGNPPHYDNAPETKRQDESSTPKISDKEYGAAYDKWEQYAYSIGEHLKPVLERVWKTRFPNKGYDSMHAGKNAIEAMAKGDPLGDKLWNYLIEKGKIPAAGSEDLRKQIISLVSTVKEYNLGSRYQESSSIPHSDSQVDTLINNAVKGTDDASISAENADEIKNVLLNQVDWSRAQQIKDALSSPNFDTLDPDHWATIKQLYDNVKEVPKLPAKKSVPVPISQVTKAPVEAAPKPVKQKEIKNPLKYTEPKFKPLTEESLQPKEHERITEKQSQGIKEMWMTLDDPKSDKTQLMNNIETIYDNFSHDGKTVLKVMVNLLEGKGAKVSEEFREKLRRRESEESSEERDYTGVTRKQNDDSHLGWSVIHKKVERFSPYNTQKEIRSRIRELLIRNPRVLGVKTKEEASNIVEVAYGIEGFSRALSNYIKDPTTTKDNVSKFLLKQDPELKELIESYKESSEDRSKAYIYGELINDYGLDTREVDAIFADYKNEGRARIYELDPKLGRFTDIELFKNSDFTDQRFSNLPKAEYQDSSSADDILRKAKGEGKTPYPFTSTEVKKGLETEDNFIDNAKDKISDGEFFEDDIYKQEGEAFLNPQRNQESSSINLNPFKSEIDRIKELPHKQSKNVADALTRFYENKREYTGQLGNDITEKLLKHVDLLNPKQLVSLNNEKMQRVVDYLYDIQDKGQSNIKLTAEEKSIESDVRANLANSLAEKNKFEGLRKTDFGNPNYLPQMLSRKAANVLLNKTGTPEHSKLLADWYDYYDKTLKQPRKKADEDLKALKDAFSGVRKNSIAKQFGPIDKAAGMGLPRSWRETNLLDIMTRFNNRYARRLAYHKAVETAPQEVQDALNDPITGIGAQKNVRNVTDDISGIRDFNEDTRTAALGIIRSAMLGPLTGAKDFVSNLTLGFQHQDLRQAFMSPVKAWSDMKNNIADSYKAGVNRHNISSLELGEGGPDNMISLARRSTDILNSVQGRNYLEKMARATAYGQGKFLVMDNMWKAKNDTLSSQNRKFLNDFVENWKDYKKTGEVPEDVLMKASAKFVESVQGTYDYRGLPAVAVRGSLAPYLSLTRWNIEKFNNFNKQVLNPAKAGNYTPLLMSTLGMFLGGEAVNQLVQLATGRREKTPNYKELAAIAKDKDGEIGKAVAYKLAGLASLSGYAGVMGDIFKGVMDVQFKNRPQVYNNPLISGVETGAQDMQFIVEALQKGDLNSVSDALSMVLEDYFQSYRLALNNLSPEKKTELEKSDKFRDLKLFKTTHDMPVGDITSDRPNPLLDKETKKFKKTGDLGEAASLLPSLISDAIKDSSKDGVLSPEKLKAKLAGIKANNYSTMPSPENMPQAFIGYLEYLRATQGEQAASERLFDYLRQREANKVKSRMVPSL